MIAAGHRERERMMTSQRRKLTEPLETVTALFAGALVLGAVASIVASVMGSGSFGGFGNGATICATQPRTGYGEGDWTRYSGIHVRPGVSIQINGTLQVCALHPGLSQRLLYTLTPLPTALAWGAVLFLLWRLIRAARRTGPFTLPVAAAMRRLGWVIIAGALAASALQGFALDQLLNTMLVAQDYGDVIGYPVHALLPVPLLAAASLLTMARIIRLGADMDDEIRATV